MEKINKTIDYSEDEDLKHCLSTMILIPGIVFVFIGTAVLKLGNDYLGFSLISYFLALILLIVSLFVYLKERRRS